MHKNVIFRGCHPPQHTPIFNKVILLSCTVANIFTFTTQAKPAIRPRSELYSYANSDWRGARVAPMAANLQWDLYANPAGTLLVRMLYNEKETAFKPACDAARIAPGSFFYDYARLRACYHQRAGV